MAWFETLNYIKEKVPSIAYGLENIKNSNGDNSGAQHGIFEYIQQAYREILPTVTQTKYTIVWTFSMDKDIILKRLN